MVAVVTAEAAATQAVVTVQAAPQPTAEQPARTAAEAAETTPAGDTVAEDTQQAADQMAVIPVVMEVDQVMVAAMD